MAKMKIKMRPLDRFLMKVIEAGGGAKIRFFCNLFKGRTTEEKDVRQRGPVKYDRDTKRIIPD